MMKKTFNLSLLALTLGTTFAQSADPKTTVSDPATILQSLQFKTGQIPLESGQVLLETGTTLRYLGPADARKVIVELWGNPASQADDVLGMIFPAAAGPADDGSWGMVITRNTDGHVSDSDAAGTDYTQVMRDMQQGVKDGNDERKQAGYESLALVGWADPPRYDAGTHKMYWAKELAFEGSEEHTLNYAVRILGRDSVLQLNAVSGLKQLPQVRTDMQAVLGQVSYAPGQRYEDYKAGSDKLASYGVAALVGGVAAKKLGLVAGGLILFKKGWILILAAFGGLSRLLGRRRQS
jgi:uncharacterized membrane-anchored protein